MDDRNEPLPLTFKNQEVDPAIRQRNWETIQNAITKKQQLMDKPVRKPHLLLLCAGLIILFAGSIWWWADRPDKSLVKNITSTYGELKTITLSDSSTIILNGHSSIRVASHWPVNAPREVWLQGEAFFNIRHLNTNTTHIQPNERFLVHCTDLTVEVLGTSFDIRQRRGKTEIVLQSGSISLSLNRQPQRKLIMKPGQLVTYNKPEDKLQQDTTEPENYTAWKEKKLLLTNPTVQEILYYLEDNYGKKIILNNPAKRKVKIEGPILLTNLDDALFIVSTVLKANIEKYDSTIVITPR